MCKAPYHRGQIIASRLVAGEKGALSPCFRLLEDASVASVASLFQSGTPGGMTLIDGV
jgi:hypothetical protein